ncbi:MAG: hypothetical protein ACYSUT_07685 [Planctomycetota bacterium]|jgi:hypothetical protein
MNFEDIQKNWREQSEGESIMINTNILLKEVHRNKLSFETMIFWRDVREAGIAIILFFVFLHAGIKFDTWVWHVMAMGCLFVSVFLIIDRYIQKRRKKNTDISLLDYAETSLGQINHQIWLLKNVFWWYLLPIAGGGLFVGAQMAFTMNTTWDAILKDFSGDVLIWGGLGIFIWWINQHAVKSDLQPRKEELEGLLENIKSNENR